MSITPFAPIPSAMAEIQSAFAMLAPPTTSSAGAGSSAPTATDPFSVLLDAAQTASSATASATTAEPTTTASESLSTTSGYTPLTSSLYSLGTSALSSASGGSASGSAIVAEAAKQIGVPYVWGGTSPTQGFDCSGLVQYTFSQLGISLPRTAAQQEQVGTPVASLAEAQPGDLLFFEPGENGAPAGEAGHVAIYIGNNEMIAAPETGEDVQVQTVPGTPLAIRRITDTGAASATATSATSAGSGTGAVQMGNVAVPAAYAGTVEAASASTGTPASFLAAILQQESGYNPDAVSPTGAEGIAQFEPGTAASNGVSPFDPSSAIPGAASLLAQYHSLFGSWSLAAAAYNAGVGAVQATGGIPQNGQTPAYVQNVIAMSGLGVGA